MVVIVVMLVGLLTFIICSELSYDDKNEEIFRDFFRFFFEKSTHTQKILFLLSISFLLSIMFLRQVGKNASIVIFGLFTETITIQKSSVLDSKPMATR